MSDLKMYTDDCETVIAHSPEDADRVCCEEAGFTPEYLLPDPNERWEDISSKTRVTLCADTEAELPPGAEANPGGGWRFKKTLSAAEWIALKGRGYFSCSEA